MKNICGPWSRTYGTDMTEYVAAVGLYMACGIDDPSHFPLPDPEGEFTAGYAATPLAILLEPAIPDDVRSHLNRFQGDRSFEKEICRDPHRTVTATIGETLMIGAEADGPKGSVYTDHRDPITFHWMTENGLGWGRVRAKLPVDARVQESSVEAVFHPTPESPASVKVELSAPGLTRAAITPTHWALPGLVITLGGSMTAPTVTETDYGLLLRYSTEGMNPTLDLSMEVADGKDQD
jgi:hypothetical protein